MKGDELDDFKAYVGGKVKEAREGKGWTTAELARNSGITPPNISHIESGRQLGNLLTYYKLSLALGKTVDWFLPDKDDENDESADDDQILS